VTTAVTRVERVRAAVRGSQSGYTWRSRLNAVLGVVLCGVAVLVASAYWWTEIPLRTEAWGDAIFSGPIAGVLFWAGIATGVVPRLRITPSGVDLRNPLRRVAIPWAQLTGARVGAFGLRLMAGGREFPVYVCQSWNAAAAMPEELRPMNRLARAIEEMRDEFVPDSTDGGPEEPPTWRWNVPLPALVALVLFSVLTFWRVFATAI
jgi:hypothetical protein